MFKLTFFIINFYSLNVFNQNLKSSLVRRFIAISLLSAGVFFSNTFYIQLIGSSTGMFSDLFEVGALSNSMNLFILKISGILLLIWSNVSHLAWLDNLLYDNLLAMSIILYKNTRNINVQRWYGTSEILKDNFSIEKKEKEGNISIDSIAQEKEKGKDEDISLIGDKYLLYKKIKWILQNNKINNDTQIKIEKLLIDFSGKLSNIDSKNYNFFDIESVEGRVEILTLNRKNEEKIIKITFPNINNIINNKFDLSTYLKNSFYIIN